ncbi:hypothetical protein DXI23_04520 [Marinobacter flavimaris]|uniref:Uncharacterized protein n=1 Tax=Marinobacter flavimaris TaxID=262076 RepID=A0A3D8H888_9GAMM|nr:hypothetical protein MDHKLMBL_15305 [Marinobacter flavimaris]RDU42928.1 hypothetical protein DXI23_04520 [Marinobacter flavimaris]
MQFDELSAFLLVPFVPNKMSVYWIKPSRWLSQWLPLMGAAVRGSISFNINLLFAGGLNSGVPHPPGS